MTLYERGSGLLETHVTWQDVESEMQKALGTTARFGDNKTARNISDKKGFISRIALIDPDWVLVDEDPRFDELPRQFIVKMSTSLEIIDDKATIADKERITELVRNAHNIEVSMYETLRKYGGNSNDLRTMKIYSSQALQNPNSLKGFIIAEFIPNIHDLNICDSLSLEELKPIVKACAALSAIGEFMTEEELAKTSGEVLIEKTVINYFKEKIDNEFRSNLEKLLLPSDDDEKTNKLIGEFMEIMKDYSDEDQLKKYSSISKYLGHKPILMHSDVWSSNVLCTLSTENTIVLKALIDFQTVSLSSPGLDAAALLLSFLTKNDRRKHKNEVLDLYYSTFCEEILKQSATSSIPYTRQQLENSYDLMFPVDCIFTLATLLDFYEKDKNAAIDKIIGLMEDVISIHASNLSNFTEFFEH